MTQAALVCREAEHTDKLGARSQMSIMGTYNCDPRGLLAAPGRVSNAARHFHTE